MEDEEVSPLQTLSGTQTEHSDAEPSPKEEQEAIQEEDTLVDNGATGGADVAAIATSRPESKGPRMPTLQSRAALARTPSHVMSPRQADDSEVVQHPEPESQVLITEVQPDVDVSEEESEEPASDEQSLRDFIGQITIETVETKTADEDFDTDLENEDDDEEEDKVRGYYHTVCHQLNVVPVSYFLRHINDPVITMRYHGLDPASTMAIALALKDNITVERLDLGGNWMSPEGGMAICRLLEENDYITEMGLAENKLGNAGAEYVCRMLLANGGLRKLNLMGNEFDDKAAQFFAEALENNKYLRELDLSHNRFTEIGADIIGQALGVNENLDVLDLSWNMLRHNGGAAIARGLKENVRLKVLNLSWNGLGQEGGAAVADALMVNQALTELDLTGNRLSLDTAKRMAKVLAGNDTIKILKMGDNLLTSAGAIALMTAVNSSDSCELEELDLTDVEVEYEFLRVAEDTKMKRPNFVVKHGPVMRAGNTLDDLGKPGIDPFKKKKEPVVILNEHIVVNDLRLVDILQRYDPSGAFSVTPEDFLTALEELAVPFDKEKLKEAVYRQAANQSGRIYFG
ncbi:hypothetical protein C0Q70_13706 [Pomacea canaliculata]|uniref:EF-hand domain-containing protein n=2 Tax=Pomacea canaliculata TaxID=400727 RepID=A0A2T7NXY1_POMCA|nr:hypothetical protein C0Q70_13706 [Pomacea canaliculata]